jgi:hypothetical protein
VTSVTVVTRLADSNDVGDEPGYMQRRVWFCSLPTVILPKRGMPLLRTSAGIHCAARVMIKSCLEFPS